ncbi:sigma-70 family RNA polymerase sigma factor [Sorangium sp. So ce124]|uniref:RNA polymerase sigma factor n=1 Tax=Sorangium sp. So ce124 TaxID=3133280 RepID=UPI003F631980
MGKPATHLLSFNRFRRLARLHGVPARDAEDVAQNALLRGLEVARRVELSGDPARYFVTIALNEARKHRRNQRRRGEVLTSFEERDPRDECPTPEELLRLRQQEELARDLLDRVGPKDRDLLVKHELEGTPLSTIAAELNVPLDTVRAQHRRAWDRLVAAFKRWTAQQPAHGRDESACVPLVLGLDRRASWTAWLRRLGVRIVVQGAFVVLTGALLSAVPPLPSAESWLHPAAFSAPGRAPAPDDVTAQGSRDSAHSAVAPGSASPAATGSARAEAVASSTPAPSVPTAPRISSPGSPVWPAVTAREMRLISQARRAIEDNDGEGDHEARLLLEAHAREFPRGRLAAEREALFRHIR